MQYPGSESNILELKREWPQNHQILKTIIAFCNTHGGKLVMGVRDDRSILGLDENALEAAMEAIQKSSFDACSPHIIPTLSVQRIGKKSVLVVDVPEGMHKPYYQISEGIEGGTYVRLGRHTMRANAEQIQELKWQSAGISFESLSVEKATLQDLNEDLMKSYKNIAYDRSKKYPSVLGILLFGHDPQFYFPEAKITCSHYHGTERRDTLATLVCKGSLFHQFELAFHFITERLHRHDLLEIPEVAIREVLLNAIVHRNYYLNEHTKISIYDDRIEFVSPGEFAGPIRIDNLKAGISYLRNRDIAKVFREKNYIKKLGSGIITIFSSFAKNDLKSPQFIEGDDYIKCVLPRK